MALVIAPEGTRSTTGHLLPFKKGTFHMWEETLAPIVPVVTIGAYDLYPVGTYVNETGRIWVRYLPPILSKETTHRDSMLRIVRRRILETLMKAPSHLGAALSWMERVYSVCFTIIVITLNAYMIRFFYVLLFVQLQLSALGALGVMSGSSVAVTAILYIYNVYVVNWF
jgi:hypothetical protein